MARPPKASSRRRKARNEAANGLPAAPAGSAPSASSTIASATSPIARKGSLRADGASDAVERTPCGREAGVGANETPRSCVLFGAGLGVGAAGAIVRAGVAA
jgi:hypothetical protein